MSDGDITQAILDVRTGDNQAAEQLWNAYFQRLVNLARDRLGTTPRRVADEEDIALGALASFFDKAKQGGFAELKNRDDLWKLLVTITVRKVYTQRRQQNAARRGGGEVRGESVFQHKPPGLAAAPASEPSPEIIAEVGETCAQLLTELEDESFRDVARRRMAGATVDEIAAELSCSTRTVERKLERIREKWSFLLR